MTALEACCSCGGGSERVGTSWETNGQAGDSGAPTQKPTSDASTKFPTSGPDLTHSPTLYPTGSPTNANPTSSPTPGPEIGTNVTSSPTAGQSQGTSFKLTQRPTREQPFPIYNSKVLNAGERRSHGDFAAVAAALVALALQLH